MTKIFWKTSAKKYGKAKKQKTQISVLLSLGQTVIVCALLLALAGCSVQVRGKQRPLIKHGRIHGDLELSVEQRTDKQTSSGNSSKNKTMITEERLTLETKGDVYNPNLIAFTAAVTTGLLQEKFDSDEDSERAGGEISAFDVGMQLLRHKAYPSSLHFHRSDTIIPQRFQGSTRTKNDSASGFMSIKSEEWPMQFELRKVNVEQQSAGSNNFTFEREDLTFAYSLMHKFNDFSKLGLDFERNEISQKRRNSSSETTENDISLFHNWIFGQGKRNSLDSSVSIREQSGTFDSRFLRWQESLRLRHTPNFSTSYLFSFSDSQRRSQSSNRLLGRFGFRHSLFQSLVTTGSVFASKLDYSSGAEVLQHGGDLGFRYRKKNRYGSFLTAYRTRFIHEEQTEDSGTGFVIDETHEFDDPENIELNKANIIESTIVVRDESDNIMVPGLFGDYTIVASGVMTELDIDPTGPSGITDGDTLSVEYNFVTEAGREEDTLTQMLDLRQYFKNGFSVYYLQRRQNQTVSSVSGTIPADEFRNDTIGIQYNKRALRMMAEHSQEDSTQISSTSDRIEASYNWLLSPDSRLFLTASNRWLSFGEPDARDVTLFDTRIEWLRKLTKKYYFTTGVDFRDEKDTTSGKTRGIHYHSELQYQYRKLSFRTGVEFDTLTRDTYETENVFVYFRLKRFF